MKLKKAYTGKGRHPRHRYLFVSNGKIVPVSAKVRPGRGEFTALLTEEHVLQAIKARGYGDAQNCAGAVCVKAHGEAIPHKFTGYVDFFDTRVFLSCRNDNFNLPTHCVCWKHDRREIAKLFDNKHGLQELLKYLQENGPVTVRFSEPVYNNTKFGPRKRGERDATKRKYRVGHEARITRTLTAGLGGERQPG